MYPYTHCFAKYIVNTLRGLPPARNGTPLECTAKMNVFVKPKRRYLGSSDISSDVTIMQGI